MSGEKFLKLNDVTVWWAAHQPDRVHVTSGDPQFTDENGEKPGLRIVFSSNPKSADYNPGSFNRVARALADADIAAPPLVEVRPRHLRYRDAIITEAEKEVPSTFVEEPAVPMGASMLRKMGLDVCPECGAVVASMSIPRHIDWHARSVID